MPTEKDMFGFSVEAGLAAEPYEEMAWVVKQGMAPMTPPLTRAVRRHKETQEPPEYIRMLLERIARLEATVRDIKKLLEANTVADDGPDNYDMTAEQIRDLIVANYRLGIPVYPSDIADEHGLDYDATLAAIGMLRKEGRIKDEER